MIQQMLAIWSLVPLPFLNPVSQSGSSQFTSYWSLTGRILSITIAACEMNAVVQKFEHSLALPWAFGYCIFIAGASPAPLGAWPPPLLSFSPFPSPKRGSSLFGGDNVSLGLGGVVGWVTTSPRWAVGSWCTAGGHSRMPGLTPSGQGAVWSESLPRD